jgi:hypothetical protein
MHLLIFCLLLFLSQQEHKYFEDAFKVYERGVKIFKYPHVKAIWVTYLTKFVHRYKRSKLERARELFHEAVQQVCQILPMLFFNAEYVAHNHNHYFLASS